MGFTLIKGTFKPKAGIPDGDSVRFMPDNLNLLEELEGLKAKVGESAKTNGTVQLRFEGIDAIEKGATKPLSVQAKENMFNLIGYDAIANPEPKGYILSRMTDPHGRPIAFVFVGTISKPDGSNIFLDAEMLGSSVNYKQMQSGYAYPLFYNSLFATLRVKFNEALAQAKQSGKGYWIKDKTLIGVNINGKPSLAAIDPIWPKLWRRFDEYLNDHSSMKDFIIWLEAKNERVIIIDRADETGFANIINMQGNKISLIQNPENLMVITEIKRQKQDGQKGNVIKKSLKKQ